MKQTASVWTPTHECGKRAHVCGWAGSVCAPLGRRLRPSRVRTHTHAYPRDWMIHRDWKFPSLTANQSGPRCLRRQFEELPRCPASLQGGSCPVRSRWEEAWGPGGGRGGVRSQVREARVPAAASAPPQARCSRGLQLCLLTCGHHAFPARGPGSGPRDQFRPGGCRRSTVTREGCHWHLVGEERLSNSPDLTGQVPPTTDHSDQTSTALGRPRHREELTLVGEACVLQASPLWTAGPVLTSPRPGRAPEPSTGWDYLLQRPRLPLLTE